MQQDKGVRFEPPAPSIREQAEAIIRRTARELPSGFNNAVIRYSTDDGFNAAITHRAGAHVDIVGWIGKKPGAQLEGGAEVVFVW